jgi:hypothetical protein
MKTLTEGAPVGRAFVVSENWSQSTIIGDRYKLGVWQKPADGKHPDFRAFGNMLFDLKADPDEVINIYADAEKVRSELEEQLSEWQHQITGEE